MFQPSIFWCYVSFREGISRRWLPIGDIGVYFSSHPNAWTGKSAKGNNSWIGWRLVVIPSRCKIAKKILMENSGRLVIFLFSPLFGEDAPIWRAYIFQMGCFNHQLVEDFCYSPWSLHLRQSSRPWRRATPGRCADRLWRYSQVPWVQWRCRVRGEVTGSRGQHE